VKGACFITHGSSNANAIKNAIRVAAEFVQRQIPQSIERELAALHSQAETPGPNRMELPEKAQDPQREKA
jgi:fatty acid/phospholipid biosynthesis enzyme